MLCRKSHSRHLSFLEMVTSCSAVMGMSWRHIAPGSLSQDFFLKLMWLFIFDIAIFLIYLEWCDLGMGRLSLPVDWCDCFFFLWVQWTLLLVFKSIVCSMSCTAVSCLALPEWVSLHFPFPVFKMEKFQRVRNGSGSQIQIGPQRWPPMPLRRLPGLRPGIRTRQFFHGTARYRSS